MRNITGIGTNAGVRFFMLSYLFTQRAQSSKRFYVLRIKIVSNSGYLPVMLVVKEQRSSK
ncbi:MAG: hypothetical protein EDM69_08580 [Chlorobiota bacterium]|nr:MAG: hypothetical protein EDM69_08580 [Chlorobiota bacterium]MCE7953382.1 hypothetical protein [Chlorobi bacterium CHB7]RIK47577.1 MAG: hypothetical protein DCC60_10315 [Ignavibacteriota bacterium]